MEKSHARKAHKHIVFIAGFYYIVISNRSARLRNKAHAALMRSLDIVSEWEEGIASERDSAYTGEVRLLFFSRKWLWFLGEYSFPSAVGEQIFVLISEIDVDCIIPIRSCDIFLKRKVKNALRLAQMPEIRLASREPCAVNSGLLTRTHSYGLTALGEDDGI